MPNVRHPRRGSLQFWPRKRSRHSLVRIRSWAAEKETKPLAFIGFKAGMTHLIVNDNRPKSLTKGEEVSLPVTIIDCPKITVAGVSFYKLFPFGWQKTASLFAPKLNKELAKRIQLPKKQVKTIDGIKEFDDLRLLIQSDPKNTPVGTKKSKLIEVALGGSKEDKLNYAKGWLGKEISINNVFTAGNLVDIHGVTKGKGFQGTVKRYGVPIRQHKAEKTKRGIATLGPWTPKRIGFTVAQPGKMGYHLRTEYNKQIIKIGEKAEEVIPPGGITNYGFIRSNYLLLKGSIAGPIKSSLILTKAVRPTKKHYQEAPEIIHVSK